MITPTCEPLSENPSFAESASEPPERSIRCCVGFCRVPIWPGHCSHARRDRVGNFSTAEGAMDRALTVGAAVLVMGMLNWSAAEAATVYSNNFETAVGPELSTNFAGGLTIDRTPTGSRGFLGRNDQSPILGVGETDVVTLTLNGLAAHNNTTLSFDFYAINSLDGYGPGGGTGENYRVAVGVGPTLLNTNFAVHPSSTSQAYPGSVPTDQNPPRTGADENNSLGYITVFAGLGGDSVYNLSFTFPHSDSSLSVSFT